MFRATWSLPILALVLATFFKALVWIGIVPIWHAPDEQAHFATIQYKAEGVKPVGKTHSEELIISERFLDTERGSKRVNKFTFNPSYKIEYIKGSVGRHEQEIENLPKGTRTHMLEKEAASYYPAYYQIGKVIYKIFYNADLFTRVYVVRLFSILPILGTTLVSYFAARELFTKEKYLHLIVPILVSFQPMVTFVNSGVTNDGLNIFLFTAFLYLCISIIKNGLNWKNLASLAVIFGLGQITRPQFLVAAPLLGLVFLYDLVIRKKFFETFRKILIFLPVTIIFGGWFTLQKAFGNFAQGGLPLPYVEAANVPQPVNLTLATHLKNSFIQTDSQTFYWYWGVFKWLSLVYPKFVNQILKGISLIAVVGFIFWIVKLIRSKEFSKEMIAILFLVISAITFALAIFLVDWRHIITNGFSLGVQGRYFLPTILPHMIILTIGILALVPDKFKNLTAVLLGVSAITLNFFALYWITNSYYYILRGDLLDQLSQYKPIFFKSSFLLIYFALYLASLVFLFWQVAKVSLLTRETK